MAAAPDFFAGRVAPAALAALVVRRAHRHHDGMFKGLGFKGFGRQLPLAVMAFAFATLVWLVFYFRFPNAPLSETEFLVAFLLAYLCGLGIRRIIAWRKQAGAAAPPEATNKEPEN